MKEHICISEMRAKQLKKISGSIKLHTGDSLGKHAQLLKYQRHIVVVGGEQQGDGKKLGDSKKNVATPPPKCFDTLPQNIFSLHLQKICHPTPKIFLPPHPQNFFLSTTQKIFATTSPKILPPIPKKFCHPSPKNFCHPPLNFFCHSIHPQDILSPHSQNFLPPHLNNCLSPIPLTATPCAARLCPWFGLKESIKIGSNSCA